MASNLARYTGSSWLDKIRSTPRSSLMNKGRETGHAVRQVTEGAGVAAALGYLSVKKGPEVKLTASMPPIPVDLAVGAAAIAAGILLADLDVAHDFRNIGTAGLTVYTYRKVQEMASGVKATVHGDAEMGAEDPIIAAARLLV